MNKKILLTLLVPLVTACAPITPSSSETSSSEEASSEPSSSVNQFDIQSTINEFKEGIKVSVEMNETYNNVTNKIYLQNTSKPYEFSFIQFKDQARNEKVLREYYVSKEDDSSNNYVYATRLNVNNQYTYYPMYNPATSEYYTWNDGYNNAFMTLNEQSFDKIDEFNYSLKEQLLSEKSSSFSTLIYGNPGLTLTSLSLSKNDEVLSLSGSFTFDNRYMYTFNADVLQKGTNTTMDYRSEKFEEVNDQTFNEMINNLKANNYTATVENYENNVLASTSFYCTEEDKVYWETGEYKSGYYVLENNLVQEIYKDGENYYKIGSPIEGSLEEVRPSLKISRACFDVNNNVYTLKAGVEGSLTSITILEAYADDLSNFTIEINNDSYKFINIRNTYKTIVTFTNIGTTSCGFNADTVLEPVSAASWSEVLDEDSYNLLFSVVGEEIENIPVPKGYTQWGMDYLEEEITVAFLFAEGSDTLDEDLSLYANELTKAGYSLYEEEPGYIGEGVMFLKEIIINNESHLLAIELVDFYSAFAIAMYIVE